MEFQAVIARALEIRQQIAAFETQKYGTAWTNEELALGFVGDVGDLAKLVVPWKGNAPSPKPGKSWRTSYPTACGQ
jgi:hypothetical protein